MQFEEISTERFSEEPLEAAAIDLTETYYMPVEDARRYVRYRQQVFGAPARLSEAMNSHLSLRCEDRITYEATSERVFGAYFVCNPHAFTRGVEELQFSSSFQNKITSTLGEFYYQLHNLSNETFVDLYGPRFVFANKEGISLDTDFVSAAYSSVLDSLEEHAKNTNLADVSFISNIRKESESTSKDKYFYPHVMQSYLSHTSDSFIDTKRIFDHMRKDGKLDESRHRRSLSCLFATAYQNYDDALEAANFGLERASIRSHSVDVQMMTAVSKFASKAFSSMAPYYEYLVKSLEFEPDFYKNYLES